MSSSEPVDEVELLAAVRELGADDIAGLKPLSAELREAMQIAARVQKPAGPGRPRSPARILVTGVAAKFYMATTQRTPSASKWPDRHGTYDRSGAWPHFLRRVLAATGQPCSSNDIDHPGGS